MDVDKIGKYIYKLREENNLSQNQLAEMIPISRQAISNWENGRTIPNSDTLIILSRIFKVSVDELLAGGPTEENNLESIALNLVDEYNDKKKKLKRNFITFITTILLLLLIFLGYYFINSYNSIKVYKINGEGENFKTTNGILITTREKMFLRLGKIMNEKNKEIKEVNLYYYDEKNNKHMIQKSSNTEVLITTKYGYDEFFIHEELNEIMKKMYLEIIYNEKEKETIKLNFKKDFANNFNFFKRKSKGKEEDKLKNNLKSKSTSITKSSNNMKNISNTANKIEVNNQTTDKDLKEVKVENKVKNSISIVEIKNPVKSEENDNEGSEDKTIKIDINTLPEKINSAMKSKGTMIDGMLTYETVDAENKIKFSYTDMELILTIKYGNVKESFTYFLDESNTIFYYKFIDNKEVEFEYVIYQDVNEVSGKDKEIQEKLLSYIQKYLL